MGIYKKGENYFIDYYVHGHRKREKISHSKKLAETVLGKRKAEIAEGKFLDARRGKQIFLSEFTKEYLEFSRVNKRPKTHRLDQMATQNFLRLFGDLRLGEITSVHLEKYKTARLNEVSLSTVNRELATLKHMFGLAVKWGYLLADPAKEIKKVKEPPGRVRYLANDEIKALLQECKQDYLDAIVLIAINTGMRKGEILGLLWSDMDLENRIIHITESKNHQRRDIPINDLLLDALKNYKMKNGKTLNGRIFPYQDIKRAFQGACARAGIKDFRFHDLRHTFASYLVMSGVDLATVKELLGHSSIEMTLRYAHLSPDHRVTAVNSLVKRWALFGHQPENSDLLSG